MHGAVGSRHSPIILFGDMPHAQPPGFAIQFERRRPHHFRQFSGRQPPQRVHLPKTILRGHKSLQKNRVFPICARECEARPARLFESSPCAEIGAVISPDVFGSGR